jgi:PIN domain nuclease of toxin-antitoxin system
MNQKYILDTNALINFCYDIDKLGARTLDILYNSNSVSYSSISVTEIVMKQMVKKLDIDLVKVVTTLNQMKIAETAYDSLSAIKLLDLKKLIRHDPFDRMLLATCTANDAVLITSDKFLLKNFPQLTLNSSL